MIVAQFLTTNGRLKGFAVKGHAGYAKSGQDIVCASVSSAVMLTVNTASESFNIETDTYVGDDEIRCTFKGCSPEGEKLLLSLKNHLEILSEDYPKFVKVNTSEV